MTLNRPLDALKDGSEFPRVDKMTTYLKMRKNSRWEFHLYLVTYDNGFSFYWLIRLFLHLRDESVQIPSSYRFLGCLRQEQCRPSVTLPASLYQRHSTNVTRRMSNILSMTMVKLFFSLFSEFDKKQTLRFVRKRIDASQLIQKSFKAKGSEFFLKFLLRLSITRIHFSHFSMYAQD